MQFQQKLKREVRTREEGGMEDGEAEGSGIEVGVETINLGPEIMQISHQLEEEEEEIGSLMKGMDGEEEMPSGEEIFKTIFVKEEATRQPPLTRTTTAKPSTSITTSTKPSTTTKPFIKITTNPIVKTRMPAARTTQKTIPVHTNAEGTTNKTIAKQTQHANDKPTNKPSVTIGQNKKQTSEAKTFQGEIMPVPGKLPNKNFVKEEKSKSLTNMHNKMPTAAPTELETGTSTTPEFENEEMEIMK